MNQFAAEGMKVVIADQESLARAVEELRTSRVEADGVMTDVSNAAEMVAAAIRGDRFYVLTHPDLAAGGVQQRSRGMTDGVEPQIPIAA